MDTLDICLDLRARQGRIPWAEVERLKAGPSRAKVAALKATADPRPARGSGMPLRPVTDEDRQRAAQLIRESKEREPGAEDGQGGGFLDAPAPTPAAARAPGFIDDDEEEDTLPPLRTVEAPEVRSRAEEKLAKMFAPAAAPAVTAGGWERPAARQQHISAAEYRAAVLAVRAEALKMDDNDPRKLEILAGAANALQGLPPPPPLGFVEDPDPAIPAGAKPGFVEAVEVAV